MLILAKDSNHPILINNCKFVQVVVGKVATAQHLQAHTKIAFFVNFSDHQNVSLKMRIED
jgi:hypothetical protein